MELSKLKGHDMNVKRCHREYTGKGLAILSFIVVLFFAACNSSDDAPVVECVDHDNLGTHIHVTLATVFNGQPSTLPAGIGIAPDCMSPTHTHDDTSLIHIESPGNQVHTVGDFFDVWGDASPAKIPGSEVENVSLNGKLYTGNYREIAFENGQRIVVAFGNRTPTN